MIKYKFLFLFVALIIFWGCSGTNGPVQDTYNIVFRIIPDSVTVHTGSNIKLVAQLYDTLLPGTNSRHLTNKTVYWQIISGGGTLSKDKGDTVIYTATSSIPEQSIKGMLKAFPEIDTRQYRNVYLTIIGDSAVVADTSVCFSRDILPIFNSNCAVPGCHGGTNPHDGVKLDSYTNIMRKGIVPGNPQSSKIYNMITGTGGGKDGVDEEDGKMPPPPRNPLTSEQIALIYKWIAEGALNKDCANIPIGGCDTTNVTYSKSIVTIINLNCAGCHGNVQPQGNINLTSYYNVKKVVDSGRLLGALMHKPNYIPMPDNNMTLPDCYLRQFQIWIAAGAPNN
jgi:hypothetical protein